MTANTIYGDVCLTPILTTVFLTAGMKHSLFQLNWSSRISFWIKILVFFIAPLKQNYIISDH